MAHVIVSILGGTFVTCERAQSWGYLVSRECQCGQGSDTLAHRLECCPRYHAGREQQNVDWGKVVDMRECMPDDIFQRLAVPVEPCSSIPHSVEDARVVGGTTEAVLDQFSFLSIGGDGSATTFPLTSFRRAG